MKTLLKLIKTLLQLIYETSGLKHIVRKFQKVEDDVKYPTGVLWAIGLYFALYQVAVLNYQISVDPINRKIDQISVGVDQGDARYWLALLPKVQRAKTLKKPNIWNPFLTIESLLGTEASNPEIIQRLIEVVESLKGNGKLIGANLQRANLEEANLEEANLQGANLEGADLEKANLEGAKSYSQMWCMAT